MNKEAESYKIMEGKFPALLDWVSQGIGEQDSSWAGKNYYTLAFVRDNKLVGGLVYHDIRPECDVWLTIYTVDKKWCCRKALKHLFNLAFEVFKCRRISVGVSKNNLKSLKLVMGLGFKPEGCLRAYREDGDDVIVFGMLKQECKWRKKL